MAITADRPVLDRLSAIRPAQFFGCYVSPGLPNLATANWSEGIDGRPPPPGIVARQANKGTPRGGFSLRSIDRLKQSAFMSVGDADNMPR